MKYCLTFLALLLLSVAAPAQKTEKYSRARILLDKEHTINGLAKLGLAVDHGEHKKNTFFVSDFSATEIAQARNAGYSVQIVIDDVKKHYREQSKKKAAKATSASCLTAPAVTTPSHFHLGSYGGYFTYTEMVWIIDSMRLLYPGLISARVPIGSFQTIEGRPIYWLRVSNDPDVEHPTRPQMLTTSVHHAREPGGLSSNIYFLWYLLENYATNPQIKAILDNTELYFVPCVNPDGYLQNLLTDPAGGGMWRKNMRLNPGGSQGVDLNRNYGLTWGYDDVGSSPSPTAQTYRGTAAFSEPETQAIKWFTETHNFALNLNFHTYNNALIYPWGHEYSLLTPDSATFSSYGSFITQYSNYRFGTCDQTLSYVSNGGSDDWMYGETTTKNKIMAMTPEIGDDADGFYAPPYNIGPDCEKNVSTNVHTASLLLPYARLTPTDDNILIEPLGNLHYTIKRLGMQDGATYTVNITSLDSWLMVPGVTKTYTGMALLEEIADSFGYSLDAATPNGQLIRYVLTTNNGLYNVYDTVQFYYGKKHNVTPITTSTMTGWVNSGWSVCTDDYYSAPSAIKSSADCNNYPDDLSTGITLTTPIDLTYSTEAWLRFYTRWGIESKYDYAVVEASVAGSGAWQPLCGKYSRPGTDDQLPDQPIYDAQQPYWVKEQMNLGDYLGQQVLVRFSMVSDAANNYTGFYLDDIEVRSVQDTVTVGGGGVYAASPALSVYPNPASSTLSVSMTGLPAGQQLTGTLLDMTGRTVKTFAAAGSSATIDVSKIPDGIYVVKAYADSVALPVKKVVISSSKGQ